MWYLALVLAAVLLGWFSPVAAEAQQEPPSSQRIRIFIAEGRLVDRGAAFVTHTQGVAAFQDRKECRGLRVTNRFNRAHFLITLERTSGPASPIGLLGLSGRSDISVYDSWGDLLYAGSTRRLGNAVKDACFAIRSEVESGVELTTMQESEFQ